MSTIWNITPSFIQAFEMVQSGKQITLEDMFRSLSMMMGGDGKSITKKQLDDYIANAEKGNDKKHNPGLTALKIMQQNWDQISGGKDKITAGDIDKFETLLVMAFAGSFTATTTPDAPTSNVEQSDQTATDATKDAIKISSDTSITDLASMLKEALGGTNDTNDDSNADLISTLTNMIASYSAQSTVSFEA